MDAGSSNPRGTVEWVDLGELSGPVGQDTLERAPRGPSRRPAQLIVAVIVVAVALAVWAEGGGSHPAKQPTPKPAASAPPTAASGPTAAGRSTPAGPAPTVIQEPPNVLGVTAGWELLGRGDRTVVRVQLRDGIVSTNRLPSLLSSGPVSFVVGADRVLVRPLDNVPGYTVADGGPALTLFGTLGGGGVTLPGPDPQHVWVDTTDARRTSMALVGIDGSATGVRIVIPSTALGPVFSDGDGYVLFSGIGGVYDARPGRIDRVTTGTLAAIGGGRLLAVECSDQSRCSTVLLGLTDGTRRVIAGGYPATAIVGAIAPDGRRAAVLGQAPDGPVELRLFDFATGTSTPVNLELLQSGTSDPLAWSPDSKDLMTLDVDGAVWDINPVNGQPRPIGLALPPLSQIAIRAVPQ